MSALGDYIHYRAANYKMYGVNKKQTGQTRAWSSTLMGWRQKRSAGYQKIDYTGLKKELMNNTINQVEADRSLLNFDYGDRQNQFKDIVVGRINQEGKTPNYSKPLKTNYTADQLKKIKNDFFYDLQRDVNRINWKTCSQGETVSKEEIKKVEQKYIQLKNMGGGQKSILGGIQQGYNDLAARTWRNTLDKKLGPIMDKTIKGSAEKALNKAIEQEMLTGITGIVQMKKGEQSTTVQTVVDETNSIYNIDATKDGWAFEFIPNRTNILKGIKKELSMSYWDTKSAAVSVDGEEISLGKLLEIVEAENSFGTHWLNMHIQGRNFNTYDIDKELSTTAVYISLSQGKSTQVTNGDFVFIDRNNGTIKQLGFWEMVKRRNDPKLRGTISDYQIPNEWYGKEHSYGMAFKRIAAIIDKAHTIQLQAAMKTIKTEQFNTI